MVGFRRVGKTSLIKAATKDIVRVYIDARRFEGILQLVRVSLIRLWMSLMVLLVDYRYLASHTSVIQGLRLSKAVGIASGIVEEEFCNFVRAMGSRRYVLIINALKHGATWSEIKRYPELREGRPISDSEVTKLLRKLVDNGFVIKVNNEYVIVDPILRRISDRVRCRD